MFNEPIFFLIAGIPLLLGGVIAIINSEKVNYRSEKIEHWFRKKLDSAREKRNKFVRIVVRPFLFMIVKFFDWTDRIKHIGIKDGIRVASMLYFGSIWLTLLVYATMIIVGLILAVIAIYLIYLVLIIYDGGDTSRSSVSESKPRRDTKPKPKPKPDTTPKILSNGQRINQETGRIQDKSLVGWFDSRQKINQETGEIIEGGIIETNVGLRIDKETGEIINTSWFLDSGTGYRINKKTGIIEKRDLTGWTETDERINPETGRHQRRAFMGWDNT